MDKVLLFVLTAGVLGAAAAVSASIYFLIKRKRFWRRALTAAMLAELAASSGAMGLTWFCILMEDFERLNQMISVVSLTVAESRFWSSVCGESGKSGRDGGTVNKTEEKQ